MSPRDRSFSTYRSSQCWSGEISASFARLGTGRATLFPVDRSIRARLLSFPFSNEYTIRLPPSGDHEIACARSQRSRGAPSEVLITYNLELSLITVNATGDPSGAITEVVVREGL